MSIRKSKQEDFWEENNLVKNETEHILSEHDEEDVEFMNSCAQGAANTICLLYRLYQDHQNWSDKTFGNSEQKNHVGPLNHLKKEIDELIQNPEDESEWADVMLLILDSWRRKWKNKKSLDDLARVCYAKLEINKTRKWELKENGVFEHIKEK